MIKMIEGDDQARVQKCGAAVQLVLDKFDCTLIPQLSITAGQMQHRVAIVAKSRQEPQDGGIALPKGVALK